jgi:hypothetical protein
MARLRRSHLSESVTNWFFMFFLSGVSHSTPWANSLSNTCLERIALVANHFAKEVLRHLGQGLAVIHIARRDLAGQQVADHPRCYLKRQVIEDWRHYAGLLVRKSFAVPWASALRHGALPDGWEQARLELVARRSDGNREFARLLELCLTHPQETVYLLPIS